MNRPIGFDVDDTLERKTAIDPLLTQRKYNLEGLSLKEARDQIERDLVLLSLERENGNVSKAANILGVTRPTLYDLMKKHNLIIAEQINSPCEVCFSRGVNAQLCFGFSLKQHLYLSRER